MTEINNGKKTLLTKDDLCLYRTPTRAGSDIYVNTKEKIFFEYMKFLGKEYMFVITENEAKEELNKLKNVLNDKQRTLCQKLWSDF